MTKFTKTEVTAALLRSRVCGDKNKAREVAELVSKAAKSRDLWNQHHLCQCAKNISGNATAMHVAFRKPADITDRRDGIVVTLYGAHAGGDDITIELPMFETVLTGKRVLAR